MNIKKATNSQLSTTESKTKKETNKQTKQTTRTWTESQIWRSFGGFISWEGEGGEWGNGTGIENHKC